MDIADLARQSSVSSRTLRYYGELGLIRPQGRGPGGRRHYDPDSLGRLRFISRLKNLGLSLQEIRQLNEAFDRGDTPAMLDELKTQLMVHLQKIETRQRELAALERDLSKYLKRILHKRV